MGFGGAPFRAPRLPAVAHRQDPPAHTHRGLTAASRIVFGVIGVEVPRFEVLAQFEGYEVRRYTETLVKAEVLAADCPAATTEKKFSGDGFRALAKYIGVFGKANNEGKKSMAMTAPVVSTAAGEKMAMTAPVISSGGGGHAGGMETMAFLLPRDITIDTAPTPSDPRIKLSAVPPRVCAVMGFTWNCDMPKAMLKHAELTAAMERDGLPGGGAWQLLRYNPPFSLPWLKTNEVSVDLPADWEAPATG